MIEIFGVGRLGQDAKVFKYGGDKTGVSFGVVSNNFGSDNPEYLDCTFFNRGDSLADSMKQGDQVIFKGRYSKNKDGYVSCIVENLEFGQKKYRADDSYTVPDQGFNYGTYDPDSDK